MAAERPTATRTTAHAGSTATATIDPIKLLTKYKWLLAAAAVFGVVVGVGLHFVWARTYPIFRSTVTFRAFPVAVDPSLPVGVDNTPVEVFSRFLQTQVKVMTSDTILTAVSKDGRIDREAPNWVRTVTVGGQIDPAVALKSLQSRVSARVVPGSDILELTAWHNTKEDAAGLARLAKDAYLNYLQRQQSNLSQPSKDELQKQITEIEGQIARAAAEKDRLIQTENVDAINEGVTTTRQRVSELDSKLLETRNLFQAVSTSLARQEPQLQAKSGITYNDLLIAQAENSQAVAQLKNTLNQLEVARQSSLLRFTPEHREVKLLDNEIESQRALIETTREKTLRELFSAEVENNRQRRDEYIAQIGQMDNEVRSAREQLTKLTGTQATIENVTKRIDQLGLARTKYLADLQNLQMIDKMPTSQRVLVFQNERLPDSMSFPKVYILAPAGMVLFVGLAGVLVVTRELIDQRVKSPSDVAMIPRTRLLGWVHDALEDPAGGGLVETAFRERTHGVVAESIRQLRSAISTRAEPAGHRVIVIAPAAPGSGATTVASNLALASAAVGQRVLLIDANFRRPALHRVFGLPDGPGLGDALVGAKVEECIRTTQTERLEILTAGPREKRVYERLSSDTMTKLLAEVKAKYDLVLIDVAPGMVSGDAAMLANRADASVLVVKALAEKRGLVARVKNDLMEAKGEFLGVVVNAVKPSAGGYIKSNIRVATEYAQDSKAA